MDPGIGADESYAGLWPSEVDELQRIVTAMQRLGFRFIGSSFRLAETGAPEGAKGGVK